MNRKVSAAVPNLRYKLYLEIEDVELEFCKELAILSELFSFVTFWDLAVLGERGKGLLGASISWLGAL